MGEHTDSDIDFKSIFSIFWKEQKVFYFLIPLSFIVGLLWIETSPVKYTAKAVLEVKPTDAPKIPSLPSSEALSLFIPSFNDSFTDPGIVPTLMGNKFLNSLINTPAAAMLFEDAKFTCKHTKARFFSIIGFLNYLNVVEFSEPSENQRLEKIVECLRNILEIKKYNYDNKETKAYELNVESHNANFSAALANLIVSHYFEYERKVKEAEFNKAFAFLSERLSQASLEVDMARQTMESFLIANGLEAQFGQFGQLGVSLGAGKNLAKLALLKERQKLILKTEEKLLSLQGDDDIYDTDLESLLSGLLVSQSFWNSVSKLKSRKNEVTVKDLQIFELIKKELQRLSSLDNEIDKQIEDMSVKTGDLLSIDDEFNALKFELSKAKIFYETISGVLQQETLKSGVDSLSENILHSKAVPPLEPSSPNYPQVIIGSFLFFIVLGASFLTIMQIYRQYIFSVEQISGLKSFPHKLRLKKKHLKLSRLLRGEVDIASTKKMSSFIKGINNSSSICIIDLDSHPNRDASKADNVVLYLAQLLFKLGESVFCSVRSSKIFKDSFALNKNTIIKKIPEDLSGHDISKTLFGDDQDVLQSKETITHFKARQKIFDKQLLSVSSFDLTLEKLESVKRCDLYIFVGSAGLVTRHDLKDIDGFDLDPSKCLGFILI